jgi:hypothetical protein
LQEQGMYQDMNARQARRSLLNTYTPEQLVNIGNNAQYMPAINMAGLAF